MFFSDGNFLSVGNQSIFTYDKNLHIKAYYMRKPQFTVGNLSFDINREIPYTTKLYGDTLVIYSNITDAIEIYLYDTSCIRKIKEFSLPMLTSVKSSDNKLIAMAHGEKIPLDIYTATDTNTLQQPHISINPTIDNIALHSGVPPAITDTSTIYKYKDTVLHIGEDIYIAGNHIWYTQDHITYRETQTGTTIKISAPLWFIDDIAISATISHFWGPTYITYTFNNKIKSKKHKMLFDDWTLSRKTKKLSTISIGAVGNDIFIAFSGTTTTIFAHYKYNSEKHSLSYEGYKAFPDMFIIKGSYAISPVSGYIMRLGTWGAPLPPSPNIAHILLKLPYILTDQYLDTLHIRWCRDE